MNIEVILAVVLQFISIFEALARLIGFPIPFLDFGGDN